jgi:predicted short-subunit dehydrogenase-like oxidoreductase (DUF2520 family)
LAFRSVCVVGAGRVGKAVAARLAERLPTRTTGRELECGDADLVLLCVPDAAIAAVAAEVQPGPWVAHTSGATPLAALAPHTRRFSVHPLQTFSLDLGPEQLDGAWAAVTGENEEALAVGRELAGLLGLEPFDLDDDERPIYHAAAAFASSFLVTLHEVAAELMEAAGAPADALEPLMRRTMDNRAPLVRGDGDPVERNPLASGVRRPQRLPLYQLLRQTTATLLRVR